jgi:ribonuclease HI
MSEAKPTQDKQAKSKPCYFALYQGKTPGIYTSWSECQRHAGPIKKAKYHKFTSLAEAEMYMNHQGSIPIPPNTVYVDGSFDPQTKSAGCGGFFGEGDERNFVYAIPQPQTSPRAELWAIYQALKITANLPELTIYTDCQYAINSSLQLCQIHDNLDILTSIHQLINQPNRVVHIHYVPGHAHIYGNDKAHCLAFQAMLLAKQTQQNLV